MTSSTFAQPNSFGTPSPAAPPPREDVVDKTTGSRRPVLAAVAGAAVLLLIAGWFLVPALFGGEDPAPAPAVPGASAPEAEPEAEPEVVQPVLTEVAGRNPFLPGVGVDAGSSAPGDATTGAITGSTAGTGGGTTPGPAGANGADGLDGLNGLDGVPGAQGPAGANGLPGPDGKAAEFVTLTYRGPGTDDSTAIFEVITKEGLRTVNIKPAATTLAGVVNRETGSLDPAGLTAAAQMLFLGFSDDLKTQVNVGFAESLPYTISQGDPFSLYVPSPAG